MHGELIEFNERLHRALMAKEALVSQMRQELIDLRGPVCVCLLQCVVLLWNKLKTITRDEIKYILSYKKYQLTTHRSRTTYLVFFIVFDSL